MLQLLLEEQQPGTVTSQSHNITVKLPSNQQSHSTEVLGRWINRCLSKKSYSTKLPVKLQIVFFYYFVSELSKQGVLNMLISELKRC